MQTPTPNQKLKSVSVTFTEVRVEGTDQVSFRVQLTGDTERIGKTNVDQLTPAEWWALKGLQMIKNVIQKMAQTQQMGVLKAHEEKRLRVAGKN